MASTLPLQLSRTLLQRHLEASVCACSLRAGPSTSNRVQRSRKGHQAQSCSSSSRIRNLTSSSTSATILPAPQRQATLNALSRLSNVRSMVSSHSEIQKSSTRSFSSSTSSSSSASEINTQLRSDEPEAAPTKLASKTLPSFSFARPEQHSIKHGHHVCSLKISSYHDDLSNLTFFAQFCVHAAYAFGLPCTMPISLPVKTSLRTVPRSPFVHKPSQENFMKKTHSRYIKIYDADLNAVGQWLDYLAENTMSGVRMKATLFERKPLGYGTVMVSETSELEQTEEQKVKEMAKGLLASGFGESTGPENKEAKAAKAASISSVAAEEKKV